VLYLQGVGLMAISRAQEEPFNEIFQIGVYRCPERGRLHRLRFDRTGLMRTINEEARCALEIGLNEINSVLSDYTMTNDRGFLQKTFLDGIRKTPSATLNRMALDQVWPLFWSRFSPDVERQNFDYYERDQAKAHIDLFKHKYALSNADWKFLCNQKHAYLFRLFMTSRQSFNLCVPFNFLDSGITHIFLSEDARRFFKNLFKEDKNLTPSSMQSAMNDLAHILPNCGSGQVMDVNYAAVQEACIRAELQPEDLIRFLHNLWKSRNFQEFHQKIRAQEAAITRRKIEKNISKKPYQWMQGIPKNIAGAGASLIGMSAILLDSPAKLYEEGQAMRHCVHRIYEPSVAAGDYMAFRIETQNAFYTLGFRKEKKGEIYDVQNYGNGPRELTVPYDRWTFDQVRGVMNDIPDGEIGKRLILFASYILDILRENFSEDSCTPTRLDTKNTQTPAAQQQTA
jgi:hypothetical protein